MKKLPRMLPKKRAVPTVDADAAMETMERQAPMPQPAPLKKPPKGRRRPGQAAGYGY